MNGSIFKKIIAVSKNGFWRVTIKNGWYSLEQKAVVGYTKINMCSHKETFSRWCKSFDMIEV